MALSVEFNYENEADFIQRFVMPLLQRLGFSLVANYHGSREFGKDIVFAEVDRLGQIRYYGLQAKYVPSISLADTRALIEDCKQAFENPFTHPHTGVTERIGTFYAVNGGSFADQARESFFSALSVPYGGSIRLLDGQALVTLDRWATFNRSEAVGESLTGMLIEMKYNLSRLEQLDKSFKEYIDGAESYECFHRLRLNAVSGFLQRPVLTDSINTDDASRYWTCATAINESLNALRDRFQLPEKRRALMSDVMTWFGPLEGISRSIEAAIKNVLGSLGTLTHT